MPDKLDSKIFARITKDGKTLTLMQRQEWNAMELGIFICKGVDGSGQLLEGKFICYFKDWNKKKKEFQKLGIEVKEE